MKKLLVAVFVLGTISLSFASELRVNCSSKGNFVDYKKSIFGLKKVASNNKNICHILAPSITPAIRVKDDGSVFKTSCSYQASDSGYAYSIKTRKLSATEVEVIVSLAESKNYRTFNKIDLHNTVLNADHIGFTRTFETNVIAFKNSKKKFTKLENIEVSCVIEGLL